MRRRIAVLVVPVLAWALASTATAQTTTSSTSATSTSTPTSTSTSTTSTTLANPCTGQPCTAQPPDAFLASAAGEVRLDRGSSCWRSPEPNAQGLFIGVCADVIAHDPGATLVVTPGETLTLRFAGAGAPTLVVLERDDTGIGLPPGNPVRFTVDYPAGSRPVIGFFTRWLQGDMSYGVRLDVRATAGPASPRPGTIALTG